MSVSFVVALIVGLIIVLAISGLLSQEFLSLEEFIGNNIDLGLGGE